MNYRSVFYVLENPANYNRPKQKAVKASKGLKYS